jgi:FAD:protein FMN transferase
LDNICLMKAVFPFVVCCLVFFNQPQLKEFRINGYAQGTTYHIIYYAGDSVINKREIDSILTKIDSSLSLYKPYSLINQFNASATGLTVDDHFASVVNKSIDIYHKTNGLFDITVYPLAKAWGFGPHRSDSLPDTAMVRSILPCISSDLLYWNGKTLMKKKSCVQLDANGIAQGYSVDLIADFLEQLNIHDYLVELGGEIRVKGHKQPGGGQMTIGIEAPCNDFTPSLFKKIISVKDGAITTSGNYRQYHESNGKKISHLLDPKTGYPVQNELISVTVYARDAITADAWDNALMAMGLKEAINAVEKEKGIAAYIIYRNINGVVADTATGQFPISRIH